MAEVSSGAVSSLLGLLQKELQLLGRVGSDVEFIREEMESMNSFLEHLSATAHLAGGHDKQVRTWMKQVRDLAHDCSNCVDNYLRSGDLAFHLARGGLRPYAWWAYWLVKKAVDQHRAALRLRELRDRVSDVGKRRLRYGVEIPGKAAGGGASGSSTAARGAPPAVVADEDDDDDNTQYQVAAAVAGSAPDPRRTALEPRTLEDFCAEKVATWVSKEAEQTQQQHSIPSIAIVAPDDADASASAAQAAFDWAATHFDRSVSIDLQALHYSWELPLLPRDILCNILLEYQCSHQGSTTATDEAKDGDRIRQKALEDRLSISDEIWEKADVVDVSDKIEQVMAKIEEVAGATAQLLDSKKQRSERSPAAAAAGGGISLDDPLGVLYQAMCLIAYDKMNPHMLEIPSDEIMQETAMLLEKHMKSVRPEPPIQLASAQYQHVLQKVFSQQPTQQQSDEANNSAAATTLGEDRIRQILKNHETTLDNHKATLGIIRELLLRRPQLPEGNGDSIDEQAGAGHVLLLDSDPGQNSSTDVDATRQEDQNPKDQIREKFAAATVEETKEKVMEMAWEIRGALRIKGIVDKIDVILESKRTLFILIDDGKYMSEWEEIRHALSLLACCANGSAVIVVTKNSDKAREFCSKPSEPINYSLVGLYHDILLKVTSRRRSNEGGGDNNSQIFREILDKCDPDEFCMRMFAHALYVNPNRSSEELRRLCASLQQVPKNNSLATHAANAKTIFKFSYRDLPREHKTCLLYLAIFPRGHSIRRSTLVERWAIEEVITREDWPTVVRHAKRCLEALVDRLLVLPVELSSTGKAKSCMVDGLVHEFISKIAGKEHILDARLSQLRARHFSTFSGLRLRASDSIDSVLQKLTKYLPKLRLLKLLDLQGCRCLRKSHLRDICSVILRLKYLSLRGTYADDLPREINNLTELEVLDIRQTKVPESATRSIILEKLRRLLAGGQIDPSTSREVDMPLCSAVQIPRKISKMENMEVLSNVMAYSKDGAELKVIRKLGQLRKLGVVLNNNREHLRNLLWAISDLKECLHSLSVSILPSADEGTTPPDEHLLDHDFHEQLTQPPKVLESLSIDGFTDIVELLTLFAQGSDELTKVTLRRTLLTKGNLIHIALLPKLSCVRLRYDAYKETNLTFGKKEFSHLKNLVVELVHRTDMIEFEKGATPELEKIVLFRTEIKKLRGVGALPNLKELELKENRLLVVEPEYGPISSDPAKLDQDGTASAETAIPKDGTTSREPTNEITKLTFKKEEFQHLKCFLIEGPIMQIVIQFDGGSAPELEKIVFYNTNIESLVGVSNLVKLREIDLKGNRTILSLFDSANHIAKVTLAHTHLKQADLQNLAKKPKLCWLVLLDNSYDDSQLTFNKDEFPFPKLKYLIVNCTSISSINFAKESACKLERMIWSFTELESLSGIDNLPELKEIELNGESVPDQVRSDTNAHDVKLINHKPQQRQDRAQEEEGAPQAKKKASIFSNFPKHGLCHLIP
uniref:Uncharacterized protein n=1 Tax=Oryza brachyantha TaxID=4533 RepID=J3M6M5_ORYBR